MKTTNDLREVYKRHQGHGLGTGDKGNAHTYIDVYNIIFREYRYKKISLLEIGILEGHSIRMWKEYFINAKIYGYDINDKTHLKLSDNSTTIIKADATEEKNFHDNITYDIIIDDGSHIVSDQIKSFEILKPKLNQNSLYIIEDVLENNIEIIQNKFNNCFNVINMKNNLGLTDNVLMIYIQE